MLNPKPSWDKDAPEFRWASVITPQQAEDCFRWVEGHGYQRGEAPSDEGIIKLMDIADAEHAPFHVRHFLWAIYHFPERITFHGEDEVEPILRRPQD